MTEAIHEPVIANVDEVLTTTRAVRRRLDLTRPVPRPIVEECIDLARQAPIAENVEQCRFVVVDDAAARRAVADVYRHAAQDFVLTPLAKRAQQRAESGEPPREREPRFERIMASALYLFEHFDEIPALVLVGSEGRPPREGVGAYASGFYGSIYPTVWSFQLALRSRGLGSSLTCIHLHYADELTAALELPENFVQVALLPVGYTLGLEFRAAPRLPRGDVVHWNGWGGR